MKSKLSIALAAAGVRVNIPSFGLGNYFVQTVLKDFNTESNFSWRGKRKKSRLKESVL